MPQAFKSTLPEHGEGTQHVHAHHDSADKGPDLAFGVSDSDLHHEGCAAVPTGNAVVLQRAGRQPAKEFLVLKKRTVAAVAL